MFAMIDNLFTYEKSKNTNSGIVEQTRATFKALQISFYTL